MKKLLTLFLALTMTISLAACGAKPGNTSPTDLFTPTPPTLPPTAEPTPESTPVPTEAPAASDTVELLNAIWAAHGEEEQFAIAGGAGDTMCMDAPADCPLDAELLDSTLGLPASGMELIDNAASLMHMMNANTFTCGAFRLKSADGAQTLADALKENILARDWMCGFPDRLVILLMGDHVISFFGNEELVNTFKNKALSVYDTATVAYDEALEV